jgi:hypothetical protein
VMGRQQFEKMVSEVDLPYPEPSRTGTGTLSGQPFKTEGERRRAQLDQKRKELVESRMRPQSSETGLVGEPHPPPGPRPQQSLAFAHPISPRRLEGIEIEGQLGP